MANDGITPGMHTRGLVLVAPYLDCHWATMYDYPQRLHKGISLRGIVFRYLLNLKRSQWGFSLLKLHNGSPTFEPRHPLDKR